MSRGRVPELRDDQRMHFEFDMPVRIETHNANQRAPIDFARARRRRFALVGRVAKQREVAHFTLLAEVPRRGRVGLLTDGERTVVTLTRIAPGTLDDDGLAAAFKAVRDGLTDALGFASDSDPRLRWRYGQHRGHAGQYAVRVRLETMTSAEFGAQLQRAEAATA